MGFYTIGLVCFVPKKRNIYIYIIYNYTNAAEDIGQGAYFVLCF